jgi:DNA polymerase III subunit epsilon
MDAQKRLLSGEAVEIDVFLKPRSGELVRWDDAEQHLLGDPEAAGAAGPDTPLDEAEFVALDVETTGNTPFWVIEIGAERFRLAGPLSLFDTLVDCRSPINSHARRRHRIDRSMLTGAPSFSDARRAFLHFSRGAALVEHSHDAFDTYLMGRGLDEPLDHPVFDTSTLSRLVLDLPAGQTPGLAKVVEELGVDVNPAHAALSDAQATAAVFRELVRRGRERFGWKTLGDLLAVQDRKPVDRSALELPGGRPAGRPARRSRSRRRPPAEEVSRSPE